MKSDSSPRGSGRGLRIVRRATVIILVQAVAFWAATTALAVWNPVTSSTESHLVDDDGGAPMFTLQPVVPGAVETRCISVTLVADRAAGVALRRAEGGTELSRYLRLRVVEGTLPPHTHFPSCAGFAPDGSVDAGLGPGVLYDGTLAGFPHRWITALRTAGGTAWRPGDTRTFQFSVTLPESLAGKAAGLETVTRFVWRTR